MKELKPEDFPAKISTIELHIEYSTFGKNAQPYALRIIPLGRQGKEEARIIFHASGWLDWTNARGNLHTDWSWEEPKQITDKLLEALAIELDIEPSKLKDTFNAILLANAIKSLEENERNKIPNPL